MARDIEIINADALDWMSEQVSEKFDLIIIDPPYNVGKNYGNNIDLRSRSEQIKFMEKWASEVVRLLKPKGTVYAFMGFRFIGKLFDVFETQQGLIFNNWICWHYTQGLGRKRGFSTRHDDILVFTKSKDFTFNINDIRVPQKYYRKINNMRGANPGDVWEFSHIHYCQANRQNHPTQKPEGLIERIVKASSNAGDWVFDPFSGSGTTLRVCQQLHRNCVGVEINDDYVRIIQKRLAEPFTQFDSTDPRLSRAPRDLRDTEIRQAYIRNHIRWFLKDRPVEIQKFLDDIKQMYG